MFYLAFSFTTNVNLCIFYGFSKYFIERNTIPRYRICKWTSRLKRSLKIKTKICFPFKNIVLSVRFLYLPFVILGEWLCGRSKAAANIWWGKCGWGWCKNGPGGYADLPPSAAQSPGWPGMLASWWAIPARI